MLSDLANKLVKVLVPGLERMVSSLRPTQIASHKANTLVKQSMEKMIIALNYRGKPRSAHQINRLILSGLLSHQMAPTTSLVVTKKTQKEHQTKQFGKSMPIMALSFGR